MPIFQKKFHFPKIFFLFVFFSINPCWAIPKTKPVTQAAKEIKVMIGLQNLKDANRRIGTVLSKYSQLLLQSIQPMFSGKKMALLLEAEALALRDVLSLEKAAAALEAATKEEQRLAQALAAGNKQFQPAFLKAQAETTLANIRFVRAEVEKKGLAVVKRETENALQVLKDAANSTKSSIQPMLDKLAIVQNMDDIASGRLAQQIQKAGGFTQAIQQAIEQMKTISDQIPSLEEALELAKKSNNSETIKAADKLLRNTGDRFREAVRQVRLLQSEHAFAVAH